MLQFGQHMAKAIVAVLHSFLTAAFGFVFRFVLEPAVKHALQHFSGGKEELGIYGALLCGLQQTPMKDIPGMLAPIEAKAEAKQDAAQFEAQVEAFFGPGGEALVKSAISDINLDD